MRQVVRWAESLRGFLRHLGIHSGGFVITREPLVDILPPGDIRTCMVALSEDERLLSKLFDYRFDAGRGLKGHSFGNLFLAALTLFILTFLVNTLAEIVRLRFRRRACQL